MRRRTVLIIVAVVVAFAGLGVWQYSRLRSAFREDYKSEPRFAEAMRLVQSDQRVVAALGGPPTEVGLFGYSVMSTSSDGQTEYGINLAGAKAFGKADVVVAEKDGAFAIPKAVFQDDKGHLTNLLIKD